MDLQKLLSVNMATLAALAAMLLAMGQRSPWAAMTLWMVAVVSLVVNDFTGWFRLNRNAATLAAVVVMAFFLRMCFRYDGEARMLAMADMLIYLQIVLLFQEKDVRVYWWLAVMSLLQVVVAAGFSQGIAFGALLVVYMLVGLCGLTLLLLYSEWSRHRTGREPPREADSAGTRWPLAAGRPGFTSTPAGSSRAGLVGELFARLGLIGAGTLGLTLVIFFTVPRLGQPAWRVAAVTPRSVVGFSDKVTLGEMGEILESRDEVMRIQLIDPATGRLLPALDELYLRGTVVTHYRNNEWSCKEDNADLPPFFPRGKGQNGNNSSFSAPKGPWSVASVDSPLARAILCQSPYSSPKTSDKSTRSARGRRNSSGKQVVLQRITVEPLDRDELFCIWPLVRPLRDKNVVLDPTTERLMRRRDSIRDLHGQRFTFELETTGLVDGSQAPLVPCQNAVDTEALLQLPQLPRLTGLANQWITHRPTLARRHFDCARFLERQLATSDRFEYSLQGQDRDLSIDAIEDFVSNHPRGHCEYFATALALMLRSQGIASRVVLGFRCDEWNSVGRFHQVRQLHAHAWVEAYLEPRQIPTDYLERGGPRRWVHGGWLRLDPTPAAGVGIKAADRSAWGQWQSRLHWLQSAWDDYVVEMDRQRQREAVYQPLVRAIQGGLRKLCDPEWWHDAIGRISDALRVTSWNGIGGWLLGIVLPLGIGFLVLAAAAWWLSRVARRAWRRIAGHQGVLADRAGSPVEFYRRFEQLLARQGMIRPESQTPREFALAAGARLAQQSGRGELALLSLQVVEAFYRIRFGRQPLDNPGAQAVEHALRELAAGTVFGGPG